MIKDYKEMDWSQKNTHTKNKRYTLAMRLRSIFYAHSTRMGRVLLN